MNIVNITARSILDSRGNPTVEAEVWCQDGSMGRASVPSGASTGAHEAHELRDNEQAYEGKGVEKAVANINGLIKDALCGLRADDQYLVDERMIELDGTDNKSFLGANAILAVSLANAHAAAAVRKIPLFEHINDVAHNPNMSIPMPMLNVLNGGQHAAGSSDFQEYMIVPKKAATYREAMQIASEIFMHLKGVLSEKKLPTTVGDEGGFAPPVASNIEMFHLLYEACKNAGYQPGSDVVFAIDVAATEFHSDGCYTLSTENRALDAKKMIDYLSEISKTFSVVSIEDGLTEDAWEDWKVLTEKLKKMQIVGDDLLVTNPNRLEKGINKKAANAILIKPNQIGTLTETVKTISKAKDNGWNTVVSHRSGETEDITISHLAVGTGAGQIKTGSVTRGERTAKHNELMRIEKQKPTLALSNPF